MSAQKLTWEQVRAWRAGRHHLHERVPRKRALDVVSRLCGLHAQVMSSAELTLWARVDDLEPDAVAQALWEDRTLVKTWAMRGTLHLLPSAEYPLWQAALGTYRHFLKPSWSRAFGVTPDELDRMVAAVGEALDGAELTRSELAEAVGRRTSGALGDKLRESWGALLKPASFRGQLCFAPGTACRPSTNTSSRRRCTPSACCRATSRPGSIARRAGSRPSWWSTGAWTACGGTSARARASRSRSPYPAGGEIHSGRDALRHLPQRLRVGRRLRRRLPRRDRAHRP